MPRGAVHRRGPPSLPPALLAERRPLRAEEVLRMCEAGVLDPDERLELLEGELIRVAAQGSPHGMCVARVNRWLTRGLDPDRFLVWPQSTVRMGEWSLPEPDVAVVPQRDYALCGHPRPEDLLLVVEVSDTTVQKDLLVKAPLYAREGVREYWQVDLRDGLVRVFRGPAAKGYRRVKELRGEALLRPLCAPRLTISAAELLGSRDAGAGRPARSRTPRRSGGAPRRRGPRAPGA